jgi:hypothetical protein
VGPDRIEVAEDEEGLLAGTGGGLRRSCPEAKLVDIAEVLLAMAFDPAAEGGGPVCDELLGGVNCGWIFTWAFHLDELAKVLEEPR